MYQAKIVVTLRSSILDPQGSVVVKSLKSLDFDVDSVRVGKYFEVTLNAMDEEQATAKVKEMCEKLLVNTVTEDYTIIQLQRMEG